MLTLLAQNGTLGLDFVNTHMIELSNYLGDFTTRHQTSFTNMARILGAIFAMIAIAMQLYKVMGRGESIDILKLARPFAFALILSSWGGFFQMLTYPGKALEGHFARAFEVEKNKVYEMRKKRTKAAYDYAEEIRKKRAVAKQVEEAASDNSEEGIWAKAKEMIEDGMTWCAEQIETSILIAEMHLLSWVESGIMWLGELAWQCMVYFTFFIKNIYLCILAMFGPIFITASILPAWENSWSEWVGKVVHVSFYGVVAYIVMIFSMQIMTYTITADINMLTIKAAPGYMTRVGNNWGSTILTLTSMFVGYKALGLVPEMASWIFPSQYAHGAGSFIGGIIGGGVSAGKSSVKYVSKNVQ